jgi:colanic acid/amylovoran biosynthesis glycosyltransferase
LEALESLGERSRGITCRFVGEAFPGVEEEMRERADALRATGADVQLPGRRKGDERNAEYAWADVFVFPSRYPPEGQPLVLLEALSAGLPIISTLHSGIPDTVRDGQEGLLVSPGDVQALAKAIERLRDDPQLRADLGARARARYLDRYRLARLEADMVALAERAAAA